MKMNILILSILTSFMVGCGGGGSDVPSNGVSNQPTPVNDPVPDAFFNNPIVKKVQAFDITNVVSELQGLTKSNFVSTYKKVHALKLFGFPELNSTFDINITSTQSSKRLNKSQKTIYRSDVSSIVENNCKIGGTVRKDVRIIARGHLDAESYNAGDNTEYRYNSCDRGMVEYNGRVTYHVNDFSQFDFNFGAIPLGTFDSRFNAMSTETETQQVTMNGTIRYRAKAEYKPKPDGSLISLTQTYDTVGDFVVSIYDKSTGETTKLTYNGTLEKILYSKGDTSHSAVAYQRDGLKWIQRETTDYMLFMDNGEKMTTTRITDNQSGIVGSNGHIEVRPVGYDYNNFSGMSTSLHDIYQMILADGTSRYILDKDTDAFPDANIHEGNPTHPLPLSDVDLMTGVVVIAYDGCPPGDALRTKLTELGIDYKYININATQQELDIFNWFNISGVPYIGINGNYTGGAGLIKKWLAVELNIYGFSMNETLVKETHFKSASMHYQTQFDDLQTKGQHTAMAVANDEPYGKYNYYRAWDYASAEEAKQSVLQNCKEKKSKKIKSKCRVYSVDGLKEPYFQ